MVKVLFFVHTITGAKQSNSQGGSQGGGSFGQVIWSGAPWYIAATGNAFAIVMMQYHIFRFRYDIDTIRTK